MSKMLEELAEVVREIDADTKLVKATIAATRFVDAHHATIAQNAEAAANYKAAFERCKAVCDATAEGWCEDATRLKALERAVLEADNEWFARTEERRVGKEGGSTVRSRGG